MAKYVIEHIVDAIQYREDNRAEVIEFTNGEAEEQQIYSSLLFRKIKIEIGDYLVKDQGEIFVMQPHRFESRYKRIY